MMNDDERYDALAGEIRRLRADLVEQRQRYDVICAGAVRGFEQIDHLCRMMQSFEVGLRVLREQAERDSLALRVAADHCQDDVLEAVVDLRVVEERRLP